MDILFLYSCSAILPTCVRLLNNDLHRTEYLVQPELTHWVPNERRKALPHTYSDKESRNTGSFGFLVLILYCMPALCTFWNAMVISKGGGEQRNMRS